MNYDLYAFDPAYQMYVKEHINIDETTLLDLVALYHMSNDFDGITRNSPGYKTKEGEFHNVVLKCFPHVEKFDFVIIKSTYKVRLVRKVDYTSVYVFDTDSKNEAEMQDNGYLAIKNVMFRREDVIPISTDKARKCEIYYPGSIIGREKGIEDTFCY